MPGIDPRVTARYLKISEAERLFSPGFGELTLLRTWDLFDRLLPAAPAVLLDVGGGPGVHAEHLARRGYKVTMYDPVERHLQEARTRSVASEASFHVVLGDARAVPAEDHTADVVLLMGPLYHLPDPGDRSTALREARRVLRPGGLLLAEVISRFAWLIECTYRDDLEDPDQWRDFDANITTGMSAPPDLLTDGGFWAYFHRPDEAVIEVDEAGFADVRPFGVEGFAVNLPDLADRLASNAGPILRAVKLVENETSLLGSSPHVLIAATA